METTTTFLLIVKRKLAMRKYKTRAPLLYRLMKKTLTFLIIARFRDVVNPPASRATLTTPISISDARKRCVPSTRAINRSWR